MGFRTNAGRGSNGHGVALFSGSGSVTTPANQPPATPTISAGVPTSSGVTLTGSAFSDPDVGDTHAASQWQVTTSADTGYAAPVISTGDDATNKTSYAATGLSASTDYIARVRYKDSAGNYSAWATSASFTTAAGGTVNRADTFTRADSASGFGTPSDNAGAYTARFGTGGISSNMGYAVADGTMPSDSAAVATLAASAHGTLSIDVATAVTGSLGLVFNLIDASNFWYVQLFFNGTSTWSLFAYKVVAGTRTQTQSMFASGSVAVNSTLQIIIAADGSFVCKIITSGVTTQQFTQVAEAALVSGTNIGPYVQVGGPKVKNLVWTGS